MKKFYYSFFFLITLVCSLYSEPIRYGFVISGQANVYADSSQDSEILETLQLTDYRFVAGDKAKDDYNFNYNGWAKILTADSTWGWVEYDQLLISSMLSAFVAKDVPLYDQYEAEAVPIDSVYSDMQIQIYDCVPFEGEDWYSVNYNGKMYWYKPETLVPDYNLWGHMFAVCEYLLYGHSSSACDGFIEHPDIRYWYDEAEIFALKLKSIIDPFAGMYILPIYGYYYSDTKEYGAGALVNHQLARIYQAAERWSDAIAILEETVLRYPNQQIFYSKAGPEECLKMGWIYTNELDNVEKALEKYHFVVKEYHNNKSVGTEWTSYSDIIAVNAIYDIIIKKDLNTLKEHAIQIIHDSYNPPVVMIGKLALIQYYGLSGEVNSLGNRFFDDIVRYPDEKIGWDYTHRNLTAEFADLILTFYRDNLLYDEYYYWAKRISTELAQYSVAGFCAFKRAELADYIHPDTEYVRKLYKAAIDSFPDFGFFSKVSNRNYSQHNAIKRFPVLCESNIVSATVLLDNTPVYAMRGDSTSVINVLSKDDIVTQLYTDLRMVDYSSWSLVETFQYLKILLPDSSVGWVRSRNLFVETSGNGMTDRNAKIWCMDKGDSENNLYFSGPDILVPVISGNVFNQSFSDIRFYDVNEDGVLDYILEGVYDAVITIISGATHQPIRTIMSNVRDCYPVIGNDRIIYKRSEYNRNSGVYNYILKCSGISERKEPWELECMEQGAPVLNDSSIYYFAADSLIACANTSDGTILWELDNAGEIPIALAVNNKALIVSNMGSIKAVNPQTGKLMWEKATSDNLDSQIPVLDDRHLYIMTDKKTFAAVDLLSGAIVWSVSHGKSSYFNFQPVVTPDYIVYSQYKDAYIVLDKYTGELVYYNLFKRIIDSYCVGGNTIYVQFESKASYYDPDLEPNIYAFNLTTGKQIWERHFSNDADVVYQSGKLFISGESGMVILEDGNTVSTPTDKNFTLYPNYPNPFNMRTVVRYALYKDSKVKVDVFNILGQKIATLVNASQIGGVYQASWNGLTDSGQPVGSGVYLCRVQVEGEVETRYMLLLR